MVQEAGVLVGEAVVILLPHVGGQHVVQGGDVLPPGELPGHLEPFGVLAHHGVHDADESLVAVEKAVPPGEQVSLQPALAHVLGEHAVHNAPVGGQTLVGGAQLGVPAAVAGFKGSGELVAQGLVGGEDAEVAGLLVELEHVPDILAQLRHVLRHRLAGGGHLHRVAGEGGGAQIPQKHAAVGVGVGAHAALPLGGHGPQGRHRRALGVKELLRPVAAQPALQYLQVLRMGGVHRHRKLVSAEGALGGRAVHLLRTGPALGRAEHEHGPAGTGGFAELPGPLLNALNLPHRPVQGRGHLLVHLGGLVPLHKAGGPAAALEEVLHLL